MASDLRHADLARLMAEADVIAATPPEALSTNVTSPVSRVITYSLLNAYRIVVVHEHLHLRQARAVAASAGFP